MIDHERASFLNVDLDIYSRSRLKPLVTALGKRVYVLYEGRERDLYTAHLEMMEGTGSADSCIRGFAAAVAGLKSAARELWERAVTRDFNIGIQAAMAPRAFEIRLSTRSVRTIAALKGRVVYTVYAPVEPAEAGIIANRDSARRIGRRV